MASFLWWRGHATDKTAKLVVRTDTTGVITISGDLDGSESADTTVNDGIVVFDFTDLSSNTQYDLIITEGADTQSCSVKTMPENGSFNITWWSCIDEAYDFIPGHLMQKHSPVACFDLGDVSYSSVNAPNNYGITWIDANTNNGQPPGYDIEHANNHMRGGHQIPGRQKAERNSCYYFMPDDHDGLAGNDWDHSITQATTVSSAVPLTAPSQAECDTHWWTNNQAQISYMLGNPAAGATAVAADIPGESAEVDIAHYPSRYFKTTIANTEFFVIDGISHRDALTDTDDSSKTSLGQTQKAWLIAAINASTATFKVVMSPKKLYVVGASDNGDTWAKYNTELSEILAAINTVKGVLWCSGDTHNATASWWTAEEIAGGENPAINFVSCPATKDFTTDIGSGYGNETKWKISGEAGTTTDDGVLTRLWATYRNYGLLEITNSYIDISIIDLAGRIKINKRLNAGSQVLVDPSKSVSILSGL